MQQPSLFEVPTYQQEHWDGMPEFEQKNLMPMQTVYVHFRNEADRKAFALLVGQTITSRTKSIWYPQGAGGHIEPERFVVSSATTPKYPVYIISKGRWESRLTSKALEEMNVPYHIVIEPQEYDNYAAVIAPEKILVLPFSNLGQGSIPARNWVWEHSIGIGAERHWILDDNINGFVRQNHNQRIPIKTPEGFTAIENFCDRYENIAMAGMNYRFLGGGTRSPRIPPFLLNTRIYSCILLRNDISHRWRGRYNEDTDLSLRILKDGWCTVLFNAFKINKIATMKMKGGNTDELYKDNGRLLMAESLREQHPDVVTVTTKWGRPQHQVYYKGFKQKLRPKQDREHDAKAL